jgi:hypothetical protein
MFDSMCSHFYVAIHGYATIVFFIARLSGSPNILGIAVLRAQASASEANHDQAQECEVSLLTMGSRP